MQVSKEEISCPWKLSRLDVQLTKANKALFAQDCKICKCMWRRCKKQTTTNFPFVLLGVRQWRNAILLQLQLETSQISVPCIWQRWKWEVYDKYFWRLGEPWQRPRQFHKTWAVALKAVRLITIMTSADFENVDLKLVFTHKESLRRKLWKMEGLRLWAASTTSLSTQRSSFKGLYWTQELLLLFLFPEEPQQRVWRALKVGMCRRSCGACIQSDRS